MNFSILISVEYTCMVKNCHDMNDHATKMTLKKKKKIKECFFFLINKLHCM